MSRNLKITSVQDHEDAISAVDGYVKGLISGKVEDLKKTFHADASMYGFTPDGLLGGSINNLYTFIERYGAAKDIKVRLDLLDMTPTTAVVRVDMENDAAGGDYTDYHSLIKLDGKWTVVAKLFHLYDK